ncbi:hypothetical protein EXIGLDRAFT_836264 [Exidia glandulosa HHB12029]|uniref:WD40 repeat-like protein n=1 Tax=Exidia glandulosa HHB12029 TaxID=1314781 RepID=A0A165HYQ9_EXIGL|nr:hypothetical protein EXIGLDRAFT_836264 [Exidia glandulosa HHB12029]
MHRTARAATDAAGRNVSSQRRDELHALLDALLDKIPGDNGVRPNGAERHSVDEQMQGKGAASFELFQSRVLSIDRALQTFTHAFTQLGSSVGLLSATFALRQHLAILLYLVRDNAADLFPRLVRRDAYAPIRLAQTADAAKTVDVLENFPRVLQDLAACTSIFLDRLGEFTEFTDQSVSGPLLTLKTDLVYWADCLREFEGQLRFPGVTQYIHDLSIEIGEHLDAVTNAFVVLVEVGVPTIRSSQKHGTLATTPERLTTIATLFSGVTATTIQYTLDQNHTTLGTLVNVFWYSSLVFSIASAVNSLIVLTWNETPYRSPKTHLPAWISMWLKRSPLVFLTTAVIAFSVGLVLFTFSSSQPQAVCICVIVFTGFSSIGLLTATVWLMLERWIYARHKGRIWLDTFIRSEARRIWSGLRARAEAFRHHWDALLPTTRPTSPFVDPAGEHADTIREGEGITPAAANLHHVTESPQQQGQEEHFEPLYPSKPNRRFRHAVRSVMAMAAAKDAAAAAAAEKEGHVTRRNFIETFSTGRLLRLKSLGTTLNNIKLTRSAILHQGVVGNISFSPDNSLLATCSWDGTGAITKISDFSSISVLDYAYDNTREVSWSSDGSYLLTKEPDGVNIWTRDGVCERRIPRPRAIVDVAWFPDRPHFLSVEVNEVVHMDVKGEVQDRHVLEHMRLHSVAITRDGARLLIAATLEQSRNGYKPANARPEKRIVVYNRLEKAIETQVPVVHTVSRISISRVGRFALASYENKVPPQLWRISSLQGEARLAFVHAFMPNQDLDFAGPSASAGRTMSSSYPLANLETSLSGIVNHARCSSTYAPNMALERA